MRDRYKRFCYRGVTELPMANPKHETVIAHGIFLLMTIVYILSHQVVEGRHVLVEKYSDLKHKGTVKTIVSEEDVIDCVDFYQQPAFDNPLIKNNIKMMPNSYPSGMQSNSTRLKLTQPWHKHGECPKGTIPIRRSSRHDNHKASQFLETKQNGNGHEYAIASVDSGQFHGAQATISVWNPRTEADDFSLSQIWVGSMASDVLNTVEAGWIVYPKRYGDTDTRFFIYWTGDNYLRTGCYDLDCDGFVQTDYEFSIGGSITTVSTYDGEQIELSIAIYMEELSGYWWLKVQDVIVGYWPNTIVPGLATIATKIQWGGEIYDSTPEGRHTTTQMGSGHFSSEGLRKSSYFKNIGTIDTSGNTRLPASIVPFMTNHACYDVHLVSTHQIPSSFYYGGPGSSANCH